jgi:hypothetical protein
MVGGCGRSSLALGAGLGLLVAAVVGCSDDRLARLPSIPFVEPGAGGAAGGGAGGAGASAGSGGVPAGGVGGSGGAGNGGAAGGGLGGAGGTGGGVGGGVLCDPVGQVPDFQLFDVNPNSPSYDTLVSPRDCLHIISAWYFGSAL